jgi:RNA polymerase sigma-70 factor (ECF subfamily)
VAESLQHVIEKAVAGDRDARGDLLQRHLPTLRAFVRLHLGQGIRSRESSMDLVNSVCREALVAMPRFEYRGPNSFRNWLLRQAENKIRDRARYWTRERRTARREAGSVPALLSNMDATDRLSQLKSFSTPSRHACAREELSRAEAAFGDLPPDYCEVILLSRVLQLSHAQVAKEMGRTPAATRTLLSRALARLATLVEDRDDKKTDSW